MTLNEAARQLASVLRLENDCLSAGDPASAALLLGDKERAARALQAALPAAAPDAHWAKLLGDLAAENRTLLAQSIEVQGRILEMVARAARSALPGPSAYGARGAMRSGVGAMALALRA